MIKKNFTLIELLVVIAIIAILTSLMTPTINYVMASSKNTHCINNIKQLGVAVLQKAYKKQFPDDILFTGTDSNSLYQQACSWALPPADDPPASTSSSSPQASPQSSAKPNYIFVLDTENFGCPLAEKNPLYGVTDEPEYRSYGALKYNMKKTIETAHSWILSDSVYQYISSQNELSNDRHIDNKVNVVNTDASVHSLHFSEVTFPE